MDKFTIQFEQGLITRDDVSHFLQSLFPENLITTSGHHVAFHTLDGARAFIITSTGKDWK